MKCQFIKNGRLFDCIALTAMNNNGFKEISIMITGKSKSVLYNTGSHHWVLPSTLVPLGKSKQKRDCVETKMTALEHGAFMRALPKYYGESV